MTTGAVPGAGGVGFQSDNTTARTRMAANLVFWYLVPGRSKVFIHVEPSLSSIVKGVPIRPPHEPPQRGAKLASHLLPLPILLY